MTRLLLACACALLACAAASALASPHRHHTHHDGAASSAAPRSLSQQHPYARPHDPSDAALYQRVKQPAAPKAESLRGSRPNLVYIMADDSGYGDLGANGFGADTPFLDKLASVGLRFTDFHSGSSVCTPSRANVMTGRLGLRTGVVDLFWPESVAGLPLNETTIAEYLVKANYSTAIIGKWHLGHVDGHHPSFRGFEQTFGLPWGPGDGCVDCDVIDLHPKPHCPTDPLDNAPIAERLFSPHWARANHARGQGRRSLLQYQGTAPANLLYDVPHPNCATEDLAENGGEELQNGPDESMRELNARAAERAAGVTAVPHVATQQCNQWIMEQPVNLTGLTDKYAAKQDALIRGWAAGQKAAEKNNEDPKPFFLYVPLSHMHTPLYYDPRWTGSSKMGSQYGDTLREMDYQVAALYASLEAAGVLDNTLIIYSSDNGPWDLECQFGGSPGPFLGSWQKSATGGGGGATSKLTTWEAGHRVPAIAVWNGKIAPGVSAAMGSHLDIVPTFLALAGVPLPADRHFDGLDLSPVLFDGQATLHDTLFHAENVVGHLTAMRYHQYKAYFHTYAVPGCGDSTPDQQQIHVRDWATPIVFDLGADPAEATPLQNVDQKLIDTLVQLHAGIMADISGSTYTVANVTLGDTSIWPCCNPNHILCRCEN